MPLVARVMFAVDALANVRYADGVIQLADIKFENWVPSSNVILAVRLLVLPGVPTNDAPVDQLVVSIIAVTAAEVSTTVTVVLIMLPIEVEL